MVQAQRRGKRAIRLHPYYQSGNDATIMTGDSASLLASVPSGCVSLVLTSPPYNIGKPYEGIVSPEAYRGTLRKVIDQCARVTSRGGSLCFQVGSTFDENGGLVLLDRLIDELVAEVAGEHQLVLRNRIIWHFGHGLHATQRFSGRYETLLWYTKGGEYTFNLDDVRVPQKYPGKRSYKGPSSGKLSGNPLGKNPADFWVADADVWDIPNVKSNHREKTEHPCQFPLELAARVVLAFTNVGQRVLDPFGGAGTTAAAAILLRRRAISIDTISEYSRISRARVRDAWDGKLRYRGSGPVAEPSCGSAVAQLPQSFARARAKAGKKDLAKI